MTGPQSPNFDPRRARSPGPAAVPRRAGGRRQSSSAHRRRRWITIAGYAGLALGCVALAGVTFLLVAAPTDLIRDKIAAEIKLRTGRELVVAGPTSLAVVPRLALSLAEVSLSAPPGIPGPPTLAAQSLDVELRPWSLLLGGEMPVKRLVVVRPAIEISIDAQGRRSWDTASVHSDIRGNLSIGPRGAAESGPPTSGRRSPAMQMAPVSLRIIEGTLRYEDQRSGVRQLIQSLDLDLEASDLAGPVSAKGRLAWKTEPFTVEAVLSPLGALLAGQESRLELKVAGQPFEATYEGTLAHASGLALAGNVAAKGESLQTLGRWLGKPLLAPRDGGGFSLASPFRLSSGQASLTNLEARLADISLSGSVTVEAEAQRPKISGALRLAELDLGALFPQAARTSPAQAAGEVAPRPGARGTEVRGFTRRADGTGVWSDDVIDFARLGLADADLALSVERLRFKDIKSGPGRVSLALKDNVANLTLEDIQLYGGRGRGLLTVDAAGQIPTTTVNLSLEAVSVSPLLKDAVGADWLSGRGKVALALAAQGVSERQLVDSLNGKIDIEANNGAIVGIDLSRILRNLEQGRIEGFEMKPGETTEFSEFAGTFMVANGVAQNQNLRVTSPHVRVTGAGSINLAQRQIDYTVRPKIVDSAAGQSAAVKLTGLEVPVRIEGPWEKVAFRPDLKSLLKSEQASDTLKQMGKNLKSPEVQEAIKGLLGGGDGQQKIKPRELLEKLLKKE